MRTRWLVAILIASACRLPNPDHCANKVEPGNAFCRDQFESRPFCSPCTEENNGCVREEPTRCGAYDPDEEAAPSTGTGGSDSSGAQSPPPEPPAPAH